VWPTVTSALPLPAEDAFPDPLMVTLRSAKAPDPGAGVAFEPEELALNAVVKPSTYGVSTAFAEPAANIAAAVPTIEEMKVL
jgi:hypothetical protein